MAVSALRFRMEADNSNVLRSLFDLRRAFHELGGDLQKALGDKLKRVFEISFIEETVRRTAEWATELAKASQEMGVSIEQMQALRIAAERSGIEVEKIFGYYSKIEAAATRAAGGNQKLIRTFQSLGIHMSELRGPQRLGTSDLLQKVLAGSNSPTGQAALLDIFGSKNILGVQALKRELGGKSIDHYAESRKSQIVPSQSVVEMARAWTNIMEDVKSILIKFSVVARVVLMIVDGLLKMVNGTLGTIESAMKGLQKWGSSLFGVPNAKAEFARWKEENAGRLKSIGRGIVSAATFGFINPGKAPQTEAQREGEGFGEGVVTAATFGASGLIKKGIEGVWKVINPIRMMRNGQVIGNTGYALSREAQAGIKTVTRAAGLAQAAYAGGLETAANNPMFENIGGSIPDRRGILTKLGQGTVGGGGSGNLAFGGVFGQDIQSKILHLNEKIVDLLQQIVENTDPYNEYGMAYEGEGTGPGS